MTNRPKKAFTMEGGPVWYFNLQFIQISNNCDERTNRDGDGIVRNKSSGRILGIDIEKEKEGKERKRDVARDYLNCRA